MATALETLPLRETQSIESVEALTRCLRQASAEGVPVYPIGGATSLEYGMPAREAGIGADLTPLASIVDYPARDLTLTVQAGVRWSQVQAALGEENQELPLDVPFPSQATAGGIVATAWTGPRRFGYGAVRDYVIGIEAVSGRGEVFHGGGRVVKNVAGYDFCKLLTGSMGTLGILSQITFRVRPKPERRCWLSAPVENWEVARELALRLRRAPLAAVTMGVVRGPYWKQTAWSECIESVEDLRFVLLLEGLAEEVAGSIETARHVATGWCRWHEDDEPSLVQSRLDDLAAFPGSTEPPLAIRAKTVASGAEPVAQAILAIDADASLFADLATGMVDAHFSVFPQEGLSATLVKKIQPIARHYGGHVRLLRNASGAEMTHQVVWTELGLPLQLMENVKQAFDPNNILNRGRFVW